MEVIRIMLKDTVPLLRFIMFITVATAIFAIYCAIMWVGAYVIGIPTITFSWVFTLLLLVCVFFWGWVSDAIQRSKRERA